MFRKRAAPTKAVNLNEQLGEIECSKQTDQPESVRSTVAKSRVDHLVQPAAESDRIQSACLDSMFTQQQERIEVLAQTSYLEQLRQQNLLLQKQPQMEVEPDELSVVEQQPEQAQNSEESAPARPQHLDRMVVIEEDENNLEVINDIDGPENSEEEEFADEIIRRTLTKSNYSKLNRKAKPKPYESKQRALLAKISISSVLNDIHKEELLKRQSLLRVENSIAHYQQQVRNHKDQLQDQQTKLDTNRRKFDEIKSVLQFLYEKGDKVQEFSVMAILQQTKEQGLQQTKPPKPSQAAPRPEVIIQNDYSEEYS